MAIFREKMWMSPVAHRQSFSVPIQITLQGSRRHYLREAFSPVSGKVKRKESGSDGVKTTDKMKKQVSNAGEDRAMLLGFTMMGLSVMMFFLLGIAILKPFMLNVWNEESNCTIIQADIMDDWVDCSFTCGVDCHGQSKYPCLQILVNVSASGHVAALHYNEEAVQINPKCFYVPKCQRDKNDLLDGVLDVKQYFERKNDTPFACFHRPDNKPEDVILIKKYDRSVVFHCLFWPTLMLVGGASIVGMVKLTQHLSLMCMVYYSPSKEEAANVTPRPDSQQSRTKKDEKTLRWRLHSQSMTRASFS
ncbi:PREDICTED: calcium-activated potassium channel subunit beta-3 isoform X1 [Nanorana parkeri]|uniref:calcium-activated potassium channel subunit beta-3 isoform X1 n=1 Tax=Nanorana parkeri TaxID=125878 RepID=UPI000854D965|nr:PREDICTED: calcium-activated potassium channel subunit beta-3 isoform X1 [Nanorana parkeri]